MLKYSVRALLCAVSVVSIAGVVDAAVVFNNGPVITNPTGGVGITAGEPISQPEVFRVVGGLGLTTAGVSVRSYRAAEDFVLYQPTILDSFTVMATTNLTSGAGNKTPFVTSASVNIWNVRPETGSLPMLSTNVTLTPISSEFIGWRQTSVPESTNGTRPIIAYTFSLAGLLPGDRLEPGSYWMEWQLGSTTLSPTARIDTPLVTPRISAFNRNFRLNGVLAVGQPPVWFESWEGGSASFEAPYAVPLQINGTSVPEPGSVVPLLGGGFALTRRRRE